MVLLTWINELFTNPFLIEVHKFSRGETNLNGKDIVLKDGFKD